MSITGFSTANYLRAALAGGAQYPFSFSAWINSTNAASTQTIMGSGDEATLKFHMISATGTAAFDPVSAYSDDGSSSRADYIGYAVNTWHHVCGVWASATSRAIYLDAAGPGTQSSSKTVGDLDNITLGALHRSSVSLPFLGQIAECAYWQGAALTGEEVAVLAAGCSPLLVRPTYLAAGGYWRLRDTNDIKTVIGTLDMSMIGTLSTGAEHPLLIGGAGAIWVTHPAAAGGGVTVPLMANHYRRMRVA